MEREMYLCVHTVSITTSLQSAGTAVNNQNNHKKHNKYKHNCSRVLKNTHTVKWKLLEYRIMTHKDKK